MLKEKRSKMRSDSGVYPKYWAQHFSCCRFAFSALSSQKHFSVALLLIFGDRNTSVPHNDQNEFSPGEKNSNASLDAVSMN